MAFAPFNGSKLGAASILVVAGVCRATAASPTIARISAPYVSWTLGFAHRFSQPVHNKPRHSTLP
jgi:hypothetical protein